jgi:DNA repair ATPase RecN
MYGSDEGEGALSLITSAESSMEYAARMTDSLSELAAGMSDLRYRAEDITEQIKDYLNSLDFSPDELTG